MGITKSEMESGKQMRFFLFLSGLLLLSSCVNNIWNESVKKDPITGEWEKWCPPILRNIDGTCREFPKKS